MSNLILIALLGAIGSLLRFTIFSISTYKIFNLLKIENYIIYFFFILAGLVLFYTSYKVVKIWEWKNHLNLLS